MYGTNQSEAQWRPNGETCECGAEVLQMEDERVCPACTCNYDDLIDDINRSTGYINQIEKKLWG